MSLGRLLAVASIVSGVAMLARPAQMARIYGLPEGYARPVGARDVVIGALMLVPVTKSVATTLRSVADASDAVVIAFTHRDGVGKTIAKVATAAGMSAIGRMAAA